MYDGLRWLQINWDEGPDTGGPYAPYAQSERTALHLAAAHAMLRSGAAYECWCPPAAGADTEALEDASDADAPASVNGGGIERTALRSQTRCLCGLSPRTDKPDSAADGTQPAIRLRVPAERALVVDDAVRGRVTFPAGTVPDFILTASDGRALYNLAASVDDHEMRITHVIRGEEHLANAPKQLLIYEAMGWEPPVFAHLPILLNAQRRKLSKRDGATSLHDYEGMGYLPEAVVNFLALLGWSPGDNKELLTRDEIVRLFDLEGVVKHPAIFETAKLGWMNKEYIKALPAAALATRLADFMRRHSEHGAALPDFPYLERVAELFRERAKTLADIVRLGSYFFTRDPIEPSEEALAKYCSPPGPAGDSLRAVRSALAAAPRFDVGTVEKSIRELAEETKTKASAYIHPLRAAVSGQAVSPGIFEVCSILGRETVLARVDALVSFLDSAASEKTTAAHAKPAR